MTPFGAISVAIRTDVLATYPDNTKASPNSAIGLKSWLATASYTVSQCDNSEIRLHVAEDDFASMLLGELELYTDHCFEQLQEIICFCGDARPRSDAWNVVAIYYFGFFAAQTFLRLIGRPTYFLEKNIVGKLQTLAAAPDGPGAGAFYVERVGSVGVNRAEYRLWKSKQKIHESCWKTLFQYLKERSEPANLATNSAEAAFYSSLQPKALAKYYHGFDWPPLIRARANYDVGFAYLLVANNLVARTRDSFERWKDATSDNVHTLMVNSARACDNSGKDDFAIHAGFLFDLAYAVFQMTRDMYKDLLCRRRLDKRWELRRKRFRTRIAGEISLWSALAC